MKHRIRQERTFRIRREIFSCFDRFTEARNELPLVSFTWMRSKEALMFQIRPCFTPDADSRLLVTTVVSVYHRFKSCLPDQLRSPQGPEKPRENGAFLLLVRVVRTGMLPKMLLLAQ